ncbi:MAG TPA: CDP-glycerol glycerophosphotransferase family protein [Salinivirgaceae bacterium]|nr:CDP-glycerol glycerophosphotransferase family protein [Salinivirgaceae bacterium]
MGWTFFSKVKKIFTVALIIPAIRLFWNGVRFFSKQNKQIILFFHTEKVFYDNSKLLFEFLIAKGDNNSFLLLKNRKLYLSLQEKYPNRVFYTKSIQGFNLFRKSPNIVISYGTSAIEFFPYYLNAKKQNIIYLGHGIPMKKIGRQVARWSSPFFEKLLQSYTYATCNSLLERFVLASSFKLLVDNVWITGTPRSDKLFSSRPKVNPLESVIPFPDSKVVLYAPTWRELGNSTGFFPFPDFDANKLLHYLESKNIVILLRGHKEEIKNAGGRFSGSKFQHKRIVAANQDVFPDVVDILPFVDILVTDYSGMYFDFLPFNRPVIFIPYDLNEYNKYKGLLFPYNEYMIGEKVLTQSDFIAALEKGILEPEKDAERRMEIMKLFYNHRDTNSCERIYEKIKNISS